MRNNCFLILIMMFILAACGGGSDSSVNDEFNISDSTMQEEPLQVSDETMSELIQNIASPVEMAALLKGNNVPYMQRMLASTDDTEEYATNQQRAIVLGILGADLGYLNMYNKTTSIISNISGIKTLADELKVGQFFDFHMLKRLSSNNENLDSLMYISISSFNYMHDYLSENGRNEVSALMVTGVWIEGLYLVTQVLKETDIEEVKERIGLQKTILSDLYIILNNYKSYPYFGELLVEINKVKEAYADVKISYELGEPESIEEDGILTIIQNEKSIVDISNKTLKKITKATEEVRNKLISL